MRINEAVNNYELALNELVEGIGGFKPNVETAEKLITANDELLSEIETLKLHQKYGQQIDKLKKESDELDRQLNSLLIGLSDCRRELMALPSTSEEEMTQVNANELLSYAAKITKYTRAPLSYTIKNREHSNLPWPTEDEMRRGVLAMAAAANANSTDDETGDATGMSSQNQQDETQGRGRGRRGSMGEEIQQPVQRSQQQPQVLDLDLFDPDDDD